MIAIAPIRYTPAGIPLLSIVIKHKAENTEAGFKRQVECEINAQLLGDLSQCDIQLGSTIKTAGFLASRGANSKQLVLHIQQIELI